jgi:hypothetical protein
MDSGLAKDSAILRVLDRLREFLGGDAFVIVDHWESDFDAIGIANPRDPGVLVYISTLGESSDRFYVELEWPPAPKADFPYQVAGSYDDVTFEQLARIVSDHLLRA